MQARSTAFGWLTSTDVSGDCHLPRTAGSSRTGFVAGLPLSNCHDASRCEPLVDQGRFRCCTCHGSRIAENQTSCRRLGWQGRTILVHVGLDQLHIPQDEKSDLRRTFRNIQDQLDKEGNLESKLIGALGSFSVTLPDLDEQVSGAVDLLLGIKDARAEDRRYLGVISLDNRKLTLSLERLMGVQDARDKASSVFDKAQEVFCSSLMESGSWCDGMLLERAYLWALACKAAKEEDGFKFVSKPRTYKFQCKDIRDGLQQVDGKNA